MIKLTENDKMLMMGHNIQLLSDNKIGNTYYKMCIHKNKVTINEGYLSGKPLVADRLKQI